MTKDFMSWHLAYEIDNRWKYAPEETAIVVRKKIGEMIDEIKKIRLQNDLFIVKDATWSVSRNPAKLREDILFIIDGVWVSCSDQEVMDSAKQIESMEFENIKVMQ